MDFLALFQEGWQLVWHRKSFWFLGALLGISNLAFTIGRVLLGPFFSNTFADAEMWINQLMVGEVPDLYSFQQFSVGVISGTLLLSLLFLIVWLITTWADASLIMAVSHPNSLSHSFRTGLRLLKRFIAIDALVFLPWFLLALLILLIFGGVVIGSGLTAVQGGENTAVSLLIIGLACVVPLSCLLIPLSYASIIFRLLAFRDAALQKHTAREAIRHTWQRVRIQAGTIIILIIFVAGGVGTINLLLNCATIPLAALLAVPQTAGILTFSGMGAILIVCCFLLLILILKAILHALSATIWTLAYQKILTL